jgi:hypothetical protein
MKGKYENINIYLYAQVTQTTGPRRSWHYFNGKTQSQNQYGIDINHQSIVYIETEDNVCVYI